MQNIIGYTHADEIIAEIESEWKDFKIDKTSLYNTIYSELKDFRDIASITKHEYIEISNGVALLPKDVQSIIKVEYVKPDTIYRYKTSEEQVVKSRIYSLKESGFDYIKEFCCETKKNNCQDTCDCKERLMYEECLIDEKPVMMTYKCPVEVCIIEHQLNRKIDSCRRKECVHECSFFDNQLTFYDINKGTAKIKYNGMALDDNGVPLIPKTYDDNIRKFLITAIQKKLLETPSMMFQDGFKVIFSAMREITYMNYPVEKAKARQELTRLNRDEIAKFVEKRKMDRYNKYYLKYSGL